MLPSGEHIHRSFTSLHRETIVSDDMDRQNDELDDMDPLTVMLTVLYVCDLLAVLLTPILPPITMILPNEDDSRHEHTPAAGCNSSSPTNARAFGPDDEFQLSDVYRAAETLGIDLRSASTLRVIAELNALERGIPPLFPFGLPPIGTGHSPMSDIASRLARRSPFEDSARLRRAASSARIDRMRRERAKDVSHVNTALNPSYADHTREMSRRSVLLAQLISLSAAVEVVATDDFAVDPGAEEGSESSEAPSTNPQE